LETKHFLRVIRLTQNIGGRLLLGLINSKKLFPELRQRFMRAEDMDLQTQTSKNNAETTKNIAFGSNPSFSFFFHFLYTKMLLPSTDDDWVMKSPTEIFWEAVMYVYEFIGKAVSSYL
jgi:hypothetical protein